MKFFINAFLLFIFSFNIFLFVVLFYRKTKPKKTTTFVKTVSHRHPQNVRRRRSELPELTTTGDIYALKTNPPKSYYLEDADGNDITNRWS